jgi:secreted Zn-dependent insulinase-like peptidase
LTKTFDPSHPASNFSCGNNETLKFLQVAESEVKDFYSQFYDARGLDIVTICNFEEMEPKDQTEAQKSKNKENQNLLYNQMASILNSSTKHLEKDLLGKI